MGANASRPGGLPDPRNKWKYVLEGFKIFGDAAATAASVIPGVNIAAGAYKALGPQPNKWWERDNEGKLNTIGKLSRVAEAAPTLIGVGNVVANAAKSVPVLQRAGQAVGATTRRAADVVSRNAQRALDAAKPRLAALRQMRTSPLRTPSYTMRVPSAAGLRAEREILLNLDTGLTEAGRRFAQTATTRLASENAARAAARSNALNARRVADDLNAIGIL